MDVMDQTDAGKFVECPVTGGWVDRPGRPLDRACQDLLDRKESFPMTGQHAADGATRERQAKPGTSNPLVEQRLESGRVVDGRHGEKVA